MQGRTQAPEAAPRKGSTKGAAGRVLLMFPIPFFYTFVVTFTYSQCPQMDLMVASSEKQLALAHTRLLKQKGWEGENVTSKGKEWKKEGPFACMPLSAPLLADIGTATPLYVLELSKNSWGNPRSICSGVKGAVDGVKGAAALPW